MSKMVRLLIVGMLLMLPIPAFAQCVSGLISSCPSAVNPQPGDLVWSWQNGQSPHTRAQTDSQVVHGALQNPLDTKLLSLPSSTSSAGLNLGIGSAPSTCTNGDLWMTGGGLYGCVNGAAIGPYGTGANTLPVFATPANLPVVTSSNQGQLAFVTNCLNGNQLSPNGTGCLYVVNNAGTWTGQPNPFSSAIIVGGQNLYPGGSTINQGNGSKIQLATGTFTVGHALAYDNNGNAVDAGVPPSGGTGGSGTITSSLQNSIPFFSSAGTTNVLSGMTIVNNAVVATGSSGIPAEVTTLPTGLTIPSAVISSPTTSGTATLGAVGNYSAKQNFLASAASGAGVNLGVGASITSPSNGDFWATSTGLFSRISGTTQGPYLYSVATTGPLTGGGSGPTLTLACGTCATTTNGGALTATSPITISAGGLISLGTQPQPITWIADSTTIVHNDTYDLIESWPYTSPGTVNAVVYKTGGTATPSFQIAIQINGTNVTSCNGLSVSSSTPTTTACTAANTITNGQKLSLGISSTAGQPSSAIVQVNVSKPAS